MIGRILRWILLLSLALPGSATQACSLPPDYDGPETNFELAEQADVILIGKLTTDTPNQDGTRRLSVAPTELIKGRLPAGSLAISGTLSNEIFWQDGKNYRFVVNPSNPWDIWRHHPLASSGSCSRTVFARGAMLLLFFRQEEGQLVWFNPAFARGAEDVLGSDDLWVKAIRLYSAIAALPKSQRRSSLEKARDTAKKTQYSDPKSLLLADDIERQLQGVGPIGFSIEADFDPDAVRWALNIFNSAHRTNSGIIEPIEVPHTGRLSAF
jgi:hypothetical protein